MPDSFLTDSDGDNKGDPGDVIRYTVTVSNTGTTSATNTSFLLNEDPNAPFVAGSLKVGPRAPSYTFNAVGNTPASISSANGLRSAAVDIDGLTPAGSLIVATGTFATAQGGSVTINADGSYTYTPQTGDENLTDSFSYSLTDGDGLVGTGKVTINLGEVVWYVDSSASGPEDGSASTPYNSLSDISGASGSDQAGDIIFIRERAGDYSGNLTLLNNQRLFGGGAVLVVNGVTIHDGSGGNTTLVNPTGDDINVVTGNTLRGLTVGTAADSSGTAIRGIGLGNFTVGTVTIDTGGEGLVVNGGTFTAGAAFTSITSRGGINNINLDNMTGSVDLGTGALSGATVNSFVLNIGSVSATYSGSMTQSNNASLVEVNGGHSGTITFSGTLSATNGDGMQFDNADGTYNFNGSTTLNGGSAHIAILNGSTGTFSFGTGASVSNPSTGSAFQIDTSNANVTYSGNLTNNNGRVIAIDGHDGGTVTFQTGTILSTTTIDTIRVVASNGGSVNINSPTITLSTGIADAVTLQSNTGGTVNFGGGGLAITTTSGIGFNATGGGAVNVTGANNTISSTTGTALNVANTTIGASGVTFRSISANGAASGIVLNNTGNGFFTITGDGTATRNSTGGTISVTGTAISLTNVANVQLHHVAITGAGDDGVFGTLITDEDGVAGAPSFAFRHGSITNQGNAAGDHAFDFETAAAANVTGSFIIDNVLVQNFGASAISVTNNAGTLSGSVLNSLIDDNHDTFGETAIEFRATGTAIINSTIQNNDLTNAEGSGISHFNESNQANDTNIINNRISVLGGPDSFPTSPGISINVQPSATMTFDVQGNAVRHIGGDGFVLVAFGSAEGRVGGSGAGQGNTFANLRLGDGVRIDVGDSTDANPAVLGNVYTILIQNNDIGIDNTGLPVPPATVPPNTPGVGDDGIQILHRNTGSTLNLTILDNRINQTLSEAIRYFTDQDTATVATTVTRLRIENNILTNIDTDNNENEIELLSSGNSAQGSTQTSYIITGNGNGTTGSFGTINFLVTAPNSAASITQASLAALSTANDSATITGDSPTFNSGAANPPLPANPLFAAPDDGESVTPVAEPETIPDGSRGYVMPAGGDPSVGVSVSAAPQPEPASSPDVQDGFLNDAALQLTVTAAIDRWTTTGLTADQLALLQLVTFEITNLPGRFLGSAAPGQITLDTDAAGIGWFIDPTPLDDLEFGMRLTDTRWANGPSGKLDLLTTVMHEMGHLLGLDDHYDIGFRNDLMYGFLVPGERRLPSFGQAGGAVPHDHDHGPDFQVGPVALGTLSPDSSVQFRFDTQVIALPTATTLSNQGTVTADGGITVLTDDPSVAGSANPTTTPLDLPDVTVAVANNPVLEDGATNLVYTFTREAPTTNPLTISFSVAGATFNTDYTVTSSDSFSYGATSGTVTFAAGSATATLTIDPTVDATVETDEPVTLTVTAGAGYEPGTPFTATGTIANDDTDISVAMFGAASVNENDPGTLVYRFTRVGVTTGSVTVNFNVSGTATQANSDYAQTGAVSLSDTAGTVSFGPGITQVDVTIDPTADAVFELSETLTFTLAAGAGYNPTGSAATGTISNDDAMPTVSIGNVSVAEGDNGDTPTMSFTITLTGATDIPGQVTYQTANGSASSGVDYTTTSGTATFGTGAGPQTFAVNVPVIGNQIFQANRQFTVDLSSGVNVGIAVGSATGTINDDDAPASIAVAGGNNQSTKISTAFGSPLTAEVRNAANRPVQGVSVTMTAPAAGASATFTTTTNTITVATNASGIANSGTVTANVTVGSNYSVTAQATGGTYPSTTFTLTNLPPNAIPTVAADHASVTTIEGSPATNTGTFHDDDGNAQVTISASTGSISQNNTLGTWSWSFPTTDGPAGPFTVTIYADDGIAPPVTTTFTYSVTNQAPTVSITGPSSGGIGGSFNFGGSFTDPALANDNNYTYSWDVRNSSNVSVIPPFTPISTTYAGQIGTGLSFTPAAAGLYTVRLTVTDQDGDATTQTKTLSITANATSVVPVGSTLTNAANVQYQVTFSDPVSNVSASNFIFNASGLSGTSISSVAASPSSPSTVWLVTIATGTGEGTIGLTLANTTGITGPDGVGVTGAPIAGAAFTIDRTQATLLALKPIVAGNLVINVNLMALAANSKLPWQIIGFQAEFSEGVTGLTAATLTGLSATSLTIINSTTAQFGVATITNGTFTVGVAPVTDLAGNVGLLGTTSNSFSTHFGDVTGDGRVTNADLNAIRNVYLYNLPYNPFYDLNGDGLVDREDYNLARSRLGT